MVILVVMVVSKSKLKARMLAIFRTVERSGEEVIVTDHGRPTLKISRLPKRESVESVFARHRNGVSYKDDIMLPTTEEWPETWRATKSAMIVLDTHVLLWWTLDPKKLSQKAKSNCARIEEQGAYISSISIWELGVKIRNKKLDIGMSIREYSERVRRLGCVETIPVDESIWIRNLELEWEHRDPADRTIVATALILGFPLLSKDDAIRSYHGIESIW